ncbi:hypothetical protein [Pseudomonas sp. UBA6323]|uniref:hypothetical protein n=1 Tax=Pseudomonas sp. UBA6323 TaxID=1947329 RepID=UPI0025FBB4E9|nr:hypothetical protein [Pseudomonas sp. UBA6323]
MTLRATGNLSGAVNAKKGDDLTKLSAAIKKDLIARGMAKDDGVEAPEKPAKAPTKGR